MDFIIMVDRINKIPLKNQQYMSDFMRFLELDSECIDLSIDFLLDLPISFCLFQTITEADGRYKND